MLRYTRIAFIPAAALAYQGFKVVIAVGVVLAV